MDLTQRKLSKSEWDSIEVPVSESELEILKLITSGYSNVQIKINKTNSIFTYLKIEYNTQIEEYLYTKYFADKIKQILTLYNIDFVRVSSSDKKSSKDDNIYCINVSSIVRLKSADQIRVGRLDNINDESSDIYEFILYKNLEEMVKYKSENNKHWMFYYYTLSKLLKNSVEKVNQILKNIIECFIRNYESDIDLLYVLENSVDYIEKNPSLFKYGDIFLYDHQKEVYTIVKNPKPKLVLYIAPTGTGKTLTPLGLSEKHKIIFVCAARHVGLALARSAISINKRIAFAFGCSSAQDVRLHYFSAKEFTKDWRSGQIRKVDNSVGDKVEIIICDIRSYISAMYYMLAFNKAKDIITYWDEPTITMDYTNHDLHKIIKQNWKENVIPNMILSSATLPKMHELTQTITDFHAKFKESNINSIVSHDCRKTIPLINNNGFVVMPHYLESDYNKMIDIVKHCEENLTLLRYFDLKESSEFISYVERNGLNNARSKFDRNFASIDDIDMKSIKLHYLRVLKGISSEKWMQIYNHFSLLRKKRVVSNNTVDTKGNKILRASSIGPGTSLSSKVADLGLQGKPISRLHSDNNINTNYPIHNQNDKSVDTDIPGSSGVYVTTKDAHSLTDGPTIFLANDLQKIAKFCIQQSNIPAFVMKDIMDKIEYNNKLNQRAEEIEKIIEYEETKISAKISGSSNDNSKQAKSLKSCKDKKGKAKIANELIGKSEDNKIIQLRDELIILKGMVKRATLDDLFIPNKLVHKNKWAEGLYSSKSFTSDIDDEIIVSIMLLKDVDDSWKILLLLGIGVFTEHKSSAYTEIMKKLADKQKLYLIIADSDYIYGTNYQFCHGYLSKDLELTQEKIIQALGRIGRNNIQQEYSARFRDDLQITTLFTKFASEHKPEVINMNQLFNSKNIKWNGVEYIELPDEIENDSLVTNL